MNTTEQPTTTATTTEPELSEISDDEARLRDEGVDFPEKPEGPIAAAILAGGIGCLALGVLTTLAEASTSVADWLNLNNDVGPLSGKTIGAIVIWLVSWAVLHVIYRTKPFETVRALTISLILIGLGVIGTFPLFFQLFASD
jgi:hypothetical protein